MICMLYQYIDPVYKDHIPNLDRGDEASKHIIFGSNVEWKKDGSKL